jgi:hypothetical protein
MSTMMSLDDVCAAIWRHLIYCTFLLLSAISIAALRLSQLPSATDPSKESLLEMALWRVGLLLVFQTAPLQWARFIYKSYRYRTTSAPLYQTMALLRMPLAIWTGGCLMAALVLWPVLGGA